MDNTETVIADRLARTVEQHKLVDADAPVVLMVSGGSDSTALAYAAAHLHDCGCLGPLAMLHVNHKLRGEDAEEDARFVASLAHILDIPFFLCEVDVAALVSRTGGNMEAVARVERYRAADEALESLCLHVAQPMSRGRICTAHTQDDRVETFYMRSIVGTGPGGFRSMRYGNGNVIRPCLDVSREDLRGSIVDRAADGLPVARDAQGNLWREDATNAHTDRFRAFVRHKMVPQALERNPKLLDVLCRTMNQIADEDDMLEAQAADLVDKHVQWLAPLDGGQVDYAAGCLVAPGFAVVAVPLKRRAVAQVLHAVLGADARIESASVETVLEAFGPQGPVSGYTGNIQGNLALSANKQGVRIEPMQAYRSRRKRV